MTIAVTVKVHDGVVLASDSASTLYMRDPGGDQAVFNVYNHADKIFNLRKGLPIGALTWGAGSIGHSSISTLAKDLRAKLTGGDEGWRIDPDRYTLTGVAEKARRFLYDERRETVEADQVVMGFRIAGYSSEAASPEVIEFQLTGGGCSEVKPNHEQQDTGITWSGSTEAITRLLQGHGTALPRVLEELGVPEEQIGPAFAKIREGLQVVLAPPPMPIQDAIGLARFLVRTAIEFSHFMPGAPTVGGPIEIAAITKHEGFKWVARKHYYEADLNPPADDELDAEGT